MPILAVTKGKKTTYIGVREFEEYPGEKVVEAPHRGYVEHRLKLDYLDRLEQHAKDCAMLAHLVDNPPNENAADFLQLTQALATKVSEDAIGLRTYDPFVVLCADAAGTAEVDTEHSRFAVDYSDKSWSDSVLVLRSRDPVQREHDARMKEAEENRRKENEAKIPPRTRRAIETVAAYITRDRKKAKRAPSKNARRTKRRAA